MSLLTTVGDTVKTIGVQAFRCYVFISALLGVLALVTGEWVYAAFFLTAPVLYFGWSAWRGYQQADDRSQKATAN